MWVVGFRQNPQLEDGGGNTRQSWMETSRPICMLWFTANYN